jgi:hypothetical protein
MFSKRMTKAPSGGGEKLKKCEKKSKRMNNVPKKRDKKKKRVAREFTKRRKILKRYRKSVKSLLMSLSID